MRRLTLLRHGHAEAHADGGDFDRALDVRGRAEADRAARAILDAVGSPQLLLASPARRTRQTTEIFCALAEATAHDLVMRAERGLYHASWRELLTVVQGTAEEITHLLVVGHNPAISEVALRWANASSPPFDFPGFATAGWCSVVFASRTWETIDTPVEGVFIASPD